MNDIERYIRMISHYDVITKERESEIIGIIGNPALSEQEKDAVREELILGNLRLVIDVAKHHYAKFNGSIPLMYFIEWGNLGLVKAARDFDPSCDTLFSTYAYHYAGWEIHRQMNEMNFVHVPFDRSTRRSYIRRLAKKLGRQPTDEEIIENTTISEKVLNSMKKEKTVNYITSIDEMEEEIGSIPEDIRELPSDTMNRKDLKEFLVARMSRLSVRQQQIMKLYYFEELTSFQIADICGCSHQAVSMTINKCLRILRNYFYCQRKKIDQ